MLECTRIPACGFVCSNSVDVLSEFMHCFLSAGNSVSQGEQFASLAIKSGFASITRMG